jgi:hypothetical protein
MAGILAGLWVLEQLLTPKGRRKKNAEIVPAQLGQGVLLGTTKGGQPFYLPTAELDKHIALIGTTGSGKTTTLANFIHYAMEVGQSCLIIDGKGDESFRSRVERLAAAAGRTGNTFSMNSPAKNYNPFMTGTPSELTDKLMALTDWSEEHYKLSAQRYLQLLFRIFQLQQKQADLRSITNCCDRSKLLELAYRRPERCNQARKTPSSSIDFAVLLEPQPAERVAAATQLQEIAEGLNAIDKKAIDGLASRLGVLAEGDWGELLTSSPEMLSVEEVLAKRQVGLFSLDSLRYPEQARLLGRLIIADLKTNIARHGRSRPGQKVTLMVDEFNVFVSSQAVDMINKSRSAGFEALLSFQSLADIDVLHQGEAIRRQIIQNCNTLIVQRQNDPKDAAELAAAIGTREAFQITLHTNWQTGPTGGGNMRKAEEYLYPPSAIKQLAVGEAIVKRNTSQGTAVEQIRVRKLDL